MSGISGHLLAEGSTDPSHFNLLHTDVNFTGTGMGLGALGGLLLIAGEHADESFLASCHAQLDTIDGQSA